MAKCMFWTSSSSVMPTLPTATLRHKTFFIWNLMVDFRSKAFCSKLSLWVTKVGNLPALFNPGPNNLGSCKLLNLLLVLVQLLEVISRHGVHAKGLGLIN